MRPICMVNMPKPSCAELSIRLVSQREVSALSASISDLALDTSAIAQSCGLTRALRCVLEVCWFSGRDWLEIDLSDSLEMLILIVKTLYMALDGHHIPHTSWDAGAFPEMWST